MKPRYGWSCSIVKKIKDNIKQNPKTFCWEWQGRLNQDGYGRPHVGGKQIMAHRLSYETFVGKIPKGLLVLHKCDNPCCVNPNHLFIGTDMDNQKDMIKKGRKRWGEREPRALLTDDAVKFIRKHGKPKDPKYGWRPLGKRFGVSSETIRAAFHARQWKHIKDKPREIPKAKRIDLETKAKIKELWPEFSYDKLAEKFNIGKTSVARILKRAV
jgi:hypothetical protein